MAERIKITNPKSLTLEAVPGQAQTIYWDSELRGFGVRVSARGKAMFFVQYRDKLRRQAKHSIGQVGVVKADAARAKATAVLSQVHLGGNPQEALRERQESDRVIDIVNAYLMHAQAKLKPRSYGEVERTMQKAAKALHQHKASSVKRADIAALIDKVAANSGLYAANRARAHLSAMWTWALKQGRVDGANPVAFTNVATRETPRDRVLSDGELALIWRCTSSGHDYDRIVRLLMLTAARREEVGGLGWAEIGDVAADGSALWTLPPARAKNGLPHEVWLGALAVEQLPKNRGNYPLAFGREVEEPVGFTGYSKCKGRLDRRILAAMQNDFAKANGREPSGDEVVLAGWRLHDLRRTFSTGANESGIEPHVVEAVLNHVSGVARRGVAGSYNKAVYRSQKLAALAAWEGHIRSVCDLPGLAGNVRPFKAAG
jgi:integrase